MQYKKTQSTVYFERGRLCNPYLGMFTSPDREISDADNSQAHNRFSYALGNPLKYSDPTGYSPEQNIGEREATGVTRTTGVYLSSSQAFFTPSAEGTGQSSDIAFADGGYAVEPTGVSPDTWILNAETGDATYIDDGSDDIVVLGGNDYNSAVIAGIIAYECPGECDNNAYDTYKSYLNGGGSYTANEFNVYQFPESGRGFARYSTNANNKSYTVDGYKHSGDGYVSASGFLALYKTFVEFYNETAVTSHYGDISAFDPRVQLGHSTHFRGSAVDIHYFGKGGKELSGKSAYKNADVSLVNSFFSIAESNGFSSNYSYGSRFKHTGNRNQELHKNHFHIGLPDSKKHSQKGVRYGKKANIPLPK